MTDFSFESLKRVVSEHDKLIDFIDTRLEKLTNGESRGAWNYSVEILTDDTISIGFDDRWDDHETLILSWDELSDDSGEKYRERQAEELRMRQEQSRINIREAELKLLAQARATVARLESKHDGV